MRTPAPDATGSEMLQGLASMAVDQEEKQRVLNMPESFVIVMTKDLFRKLRKIRSKLMKEPNSAVEKLPCGHGGLRAGYNSSYHPQCTVTCSAGCHVSLDVLNRSLGRRVGAEHEALRKLAIALALQQCWTGETPSQTMEVLIRAFPGHKEDLEAFADGAKAITDLASTNEVLKLDTSPPKKGYRTLPRLLLGKQVIEEGCIDNI